MGSNLMSNEDAAFTPSETVDLLRRIQTYLHGQHLASLHHLTVEVAGDAVLIAGDVDSFYERQVAIECCKRVSGVRRVLDHIRVTPADDSNASTENVVATQSNEPWNNDTFDKLFRATR
jgi:hypothetical protein